MTLWSLAVLAIGCSGRSTNRWVQQLRDGDADVRRAAARALAGPRVDRESAAPALAAALDDSDLEVRELAVAALGGMGTDGLAALEHALVDGESSVRVGAALAIQEIDPLRSSYVPVLRDAMRAGNGPLFFEIGKLGAKGHWAVPTLVQLLSDERAPIRALAAQTLGQIGPAARDAEPALRRSLRDDAPAVRRAAEKSLPQIQGRASSPEPPGLRR